MSEEKVPKFVFLKKFLMIVGIIAIIFIFLVVILFIYLISTKPLGIDINPLNFNKVDATYDHPLLSADQEKTLQAIGVDVKSIPTSISPAQEKCAVYALGQDRVNQIKAGSAPSISDYLSAKNCF